MALAAEQPDAAPRYPASGGDPAAHIPHWVPAVSSPAVKPVQLSSCWNIQQDLLAIEELVPWKAVVKKWRQQRKHWRRSLQGGNMPVAAVAACLAELRMALLRSSALPCGKAWDQLLQACLAGRGTPESLAAIVADFQAALALWLEPSPGSAGPASPSTPYHHQGSRPAAGSSSLQPAQLGRHSYHGSQPQQLAQLSPAGAMQHMFCSQAPQKQLLVSAVSVQDLCGLSVPQSCLLCKLEAHGAHCASSGEETDMSGSD